ncbi:hypothetical protein T459_27115 [Capsicum annuum]|uniref:Ubiquitin-like protease family profile domain-containing protein n=1 Tax=Capsicum annuum TaxID=4072 RepID=A0A2G2YD03_CAPAN|nr:hypothetical protein T459_27115 [Capsicum annuum]
MNSDLGPSFSLEFPQLESIKESQEVVNFVLGSFNYEFVGFDENRSKHRNDPQTMKKLRQKHAKKDKKKSDFKRKGSSSPASKAHAKRRRIIEIIFKDELPKEIPTHPLRFVSSCNLRFKDEIKEVVGQEILDLLEKTIFECYLKTNDGMMRDCGVFVAVYVEYLSKGLGIPSSGIDAQYHRLRYASLLCKYGSEKTENDYFSENDYQPRRAPVLPFHHPILYASS